MDNKLYYYLKPTESPHLDFTANQIYTSQGLLCVLLFHLEAPFNKDIAKTLKAYVNDEKITVSRIVPHLSTAS